MTFGTRPGAVQEKKFMGSSFVDVELLNNSLSHSPIFLLFQELESNLSPEKGFLRTKRNPLEPPLHADKRLHYRPSSQD